jgi:hypothetical protein
MSSYDATRITQIKAELTAINAAILSVAGGAQSYTLDTGQSVQKVTRATLDDLRKMKDSLMNELEVLESKTNNTGTLEGHPGW